MTRECAGLHETWKSEWPDACGQIFLTGNAMEHGRDGEMIPLDKYFLHIKLWIMGEPAMIPLVKYFLHIELWTTGESEACYLLQDIYRWTHEMREGWNCRIPDALGRPSHLLLFIVVVLLILPFLIMFLYFILINTGNASPAECLRPSSMVICLPTAISFR